MSYHRDYDYSRRSGHGDYRRGKGREFDSSGDGYYRGRDYTFVKPERNRCRSRDHNGNGFMEVVACMIFEILVETGVMVVDIIWVVQFVEETVSEVLL